MPRLQLVSSQTRKVPSRSQSRDPASVPGSKLRRLSQGLYDAKEYAKGCARETGLSRARSRAPKDSKERRLVIAGRDDAIVRVIDDSVPIAFADPKPWPRRKNSRAERNPVPQRSRTLDDRHDKALSRLNTRSSSDEEIEQTVDDKTRVDRARRTHESPQNGQRQNRSRHADDVDTNINLKVNVSYQKPYTSAVDSSRALTALNFANLSLLPADAERRRRVRHGLEQPDEIRPITSYVAPTAPPATRRHLADPTPIPTTRSSRHSSPISGGKLKILVVGGTGVGKSTLINQLCNRSTHRPKIGHTLMSCTSDVQSFDCTLDGANFQLIDSAGFDDNRMSDEEVLKRLAMYLASNPGIHGVIFCHRISDTRLTGSAAKTAQIIHELCGPAFQDRIALVTTMWDRVRDKSVAVRRETELLQHPRFWRQFHQARGRPVQAFRFSLSSDGDVDSAEEIAEFFLDRKDELLKRPVELQLATEMRLQKPLSKTAAGAVLTPRQALTYRSRDRRHSQDSNSS